MELKTCCTCEKEFPKTTDYFFKKTIKQKNKSGVATYYSFRSDCKTCHGKKGSKRRIKNRCLELECDVSKYREHWKKQYSETRTIDTEAKNKLTKGQYNVYKKMLKDGVVNTLEDYKSKVYKNKHSKPWLRKNHYSGKVFLSEEERQRKNNENKIKNISDAYIVNYLGFKIADVPKEIIEQKRLIIKLKRITNQTNYGS